jgi:hypothetical protein
VRPGGDLLLVEGGGCGERRYVTSLTSVDPADGRPRWAVRFPDGRPVVVGDGWFAAVGDTGGLDTYAMDGRRVFGATVTETSIVLAAGGSVIAADQPDPGRPGRLTGLPHDGSGPGWSVPLDGAAAACGPWLCVTAGGVTRALDPATGRVRWSMDVLRDPAPGASYVVGAGAAGARVVRWSDGGARTLPGWRLLPPVEGSAAPVVQRGGAAGVVDLTVGRLDVLGTLPGPQTRCLAGGAGAGRTGLRLVCLDSAGRTGLWRTG